MTGARPSSRPGSTWPGRRCCAPLVRLGPAGHRLVLTNHHILIDGWSLPLLVGELFAAYAAGGDAGGLPPVTPYRDYLALLAGRDRAASAATGRAYLAGFDHPDAGRAARRAATGRYPPRP